MGFKMGDTLIQPKPPSTRRKEAAFACIDVNVSKNS